MHRSHFSKYSVVWTDLKARIQRHYDIAAPLYRDLWGIHVHHGYWQDGAETKELAQEQLIAVLAESAEIQRGARILDVGCGFGGSAKYLADRFAAHVLGIGISRKQIEAAVEITEKCFPRPLFVLMDAEYLGIRAAFDVIWSIETVSHLSNKTDCFRQALELLEPHGRIVIIDWFKAEGLTKDHARELVDPIIHSMLLPSLHTMRDYAEIFERLGCRILNLQDYCGA